MNKEMVLQVTREGYQFIREKCLKCETNIKTLNPGLKIEIIENDDLDSQNGMLLSPTGSKRISLF